jgi:prefoldin alpha subunit
VEALTANFQQLKEAQARFQESVAAIQAIPADGPGREVMVPLTSSLYVPGTLASTDELLIDIGTGFYVCECARRRADRRGGQLHERKQPMSCVRALTPPSPPAPSLPALPPAAKTSAQATEMLSRKAATLKQNTDGLMKFVAQKQDNLAAVSAHVEERYNAMKAQQYQQQQLQGGGGAPTGGSGPGRAGSYAAAAAAAAGR